MPNESGVTSSSTRFFISPDKTLPWIAAPTATHCIGSTPFSGFFPKNFLTLSLTIGILVGPPTRITLSISSGFSDASFKACFIGLSILWTTGLTSVSSLSLFKTMFPFVNGRFIFAEDLKDSCIFAFSTASFSCCKSFSSLNLIFFSLIFFST